MTRVMVNRLVHTVGVIQSGAVVQAKRSISGAKVDDRKSLECKNDAIEMILS